MPGFGPLDDVTGEPALLDAREPEGTIAFYVAEDADDTMGLGERLTRRAIPIDRLRESLGDLTGRLHQVFDGLPSGEVGQMKLRSVQIGVEVSAEGGITLVGSGKVGAKAAILLTFSE